MRPISLSMNCVTKLHANPMATRESFRERFRGASGGALLFERQNLSRINLSIAAFRSDSRFQNPEEIAGIQPSLLLQRDLSQAGIQL